MRNRALDHLRVVLSLMVVGIHGHFLSDLSPSTGQFLQNYVFRVAVPVFFIINGYYFSNINDELALKQWCTRLAVLYVTWTIVYTPLIFHAHQPSIAELYSVVRTLLIGYMQLWYLPAVLLAGIALFLLRRKSESVLLIVCMALYLIGVAIEYFLIYRHTELRYGEWLLSKNWIYRNFLFFALPFMGLGYAIKGASLDSRIHPRVRYVVLVIGSAGLVVEFYVNQRLGLPVDQSLDLLFALPIVSVAVFLIVVGFKSTTRSSLAANLSVVIFLAHVLMLSLLRALGVTSPTMATLGAIFGCLLVAPFLLRLNRSWPIFL